MARALAPAVPPLTAALAGAYNKGQGHKHRDESLRGRHKCPRHVRPYRATISFVTFAVNPFCVTTRSSAPVRAPAGTTKLI